MLRENLQSCAMRLFSRGHEPAKGLISGRLMLLPDESHPLQPIMYGRFRLVCVAA